MDGFIKKSLSRILLSLFLIASTQNLQAMEAQDPKEESSSSSSLTHVTTTNVTTHIVKVPVNRGKLAKAFFAAKDGLFWTAKYPFKKISATTIHLLKTAKELGLVALNTAELAAYLYALDYVLLLAAPYISAHMPLSSWPIMIQDVVTQIARVYEPGKFISLLSTIVNKLHAANYSPTQLLCPATTPTGCWLF